MKKAEIFSALATEMKNLGFRRRKSNYEYVLDIGEGFEGWCSFADSVKGGDRNTLWVATFVGIRCEQIEERISRWCGEVVPGWDGRSYVATVSMNVGYAGDGAEWSEHAVRLDGVSARAETARSVGDVADIAAGFISGHASYSGLVRAMRTKGGQLADRRRERLPLAMALLGDMQGAHRELTEMRQQVDEGSFLAPRYLNYLGSFLEEFPAAR